MSIGTGTQALTFTHVQNKTQVKTVSHVITQSEAVATYIHEDLSDLVQNMHVDLTHVLALPANRATSNSRILLEYLYEDIGLLLRNALISRVHFLLYDPHMDSMTKAYPVLYEATYEIMLQRGLQQQGPQRHGGLLTPPKHLIGHVDFVILVDWHPNADMMRRQRAVSPTYHFNWVSPQCRYDPTSLVRFREGALTMDGATIINRVEQK